MASVLCRCSSCLLRSIPVTDEVHCTASLSTHANSCSATELGYSDVVVYPPYYVGLVRT